MDPSIRECYTTLGLQPGASAEEVVQSYHDLARAWHPDRFPADSRLKGKAEEMMRRINGAYSEIRAYLRAAGDGAGWPDDPEARRRQEIQVREERARQEAARREAEVRLRQESETRILENAANRAAEIEREQTSWDQKIHAMRDAAARRRIVEEAEQEQARWGRKADAVPTASSAECTSSQKRAASPLRALSRLKRRPAQETVVRP